MRLEGGGEGRGEMGYEGVEEEGGGISHVYLGPGRNFVVGTVWTYIHVFLILDGVSWTPAQAKLCIYCSLVRGPFYFPADIPGA